MDSREIWLTFYTADYYLQEHFLFKCEKKLNCLGVRRVHLGILRELIPNTMKQQIHWHSSLYVITGQVYIYRQFQQSWDPESLLT